jgi:hypothetical protein
LLIRPLLIIMGSRLQIKVPQQISKEQPHLRVGQAGSLVSILPDDGAFGV